MKIVIAILFIFFSLKTSAQTQFQFDIESLKNELIFNKTAFATYDFTLKSKNSVLDLKPKDDFYNNYKRFKKLFSYLESYSLITTPIETHNTGGIFINIDNIGKRYFDDNYKNYRKDLSSYLPKVPDVFWLCPIY